MGAPLWKRQAPAGPRVCNVCGALVTTEGMVSLCDKHLKEWFKTDSYLHYKYMKEEEGKLSSQELMNEAGLELWDKWWKRYWDFVRQTKLRNLGV